MSRMRLVVRSPRRGRAAPARAFATAAFVVMSAVAGFAQTITAPMAGGEATPTATATPADAAKSAAPKGGFSIVEPPNLDSPKTKASERDSTKSAADKADPSSGASAPKPMKKKAVRRDPAFLPATGGSVVDSPSAPADTIREYEIRLEAHRRELLQREAALESAERKIAELTHAKTSSPSAPAPNGDSDVQIRRLEDARALDDAEIKRLRDRTRELEDRLAAVPPAPSTNPGAPETPSPAAPPRAEDASQSIIASLRQELDVERENRATLEKEIQRLITDAQASDQAQLLSRSLESARAEILVLNHRLAEEQATRESLEVTIERMRESAGIAPSADWLSRFDSSMKERKEQADRLQEQLHSANEAIVALKAQLEVTPKDPAAPVDTARVAKLESEIKQLHDALEGAQQANADLRTQAELASRLAELLYGQPH